MSGLKAHCMLCFYKTWNCWMWNCCILSSLHSLKPKSFISKKIYSLSLTWLAKSVCSSSCSRTQDLPGIPSWWKTEVMEQILWLLSRTCSSGNRGQEQTWWTRQQHSWERCWVDLQYWHLQLLLTEPPPQPVHTDPAREKEIGCSYHLGSLINSGDHMETFNIPQWNFAIIYISKKLGISSCIEYNLI